MPEAVRAQRQNEAAALADGAFYADGAAMQFHQTPGGGQSQPGARALCGSAGGAAHLVNLVEDRLQFRFGDADSGIAHTKARGVLAAGVGNPHAAVLRGKAPLGLCGPRPCSSHPQLKRFRTKTCREIATP